MGIRVGRLLRSDGRFPTARFAVFTARSLGPPLHSLPARMQQNRLDGLSDARLLDSMFR